MPRSQTMDSSGPRASAVALLLTLAGFATACGVGSDEGSPNAFEPVPSEVSGDAVTVAEATLKAGYAGTSREPAPGPAAVTGKSVYVVSCGSVIIGCNVPAEEIKTAGASLGWEVTVLDGKANPADYAVAIDQAVAAGADGIITIGVDCALAKASYEKAAAANIPTVGVYNLDCGATGGKDSLTAVMDAGTGQSSGQWFYDWGVLKANEVIANSQGAAKILQINVDGFGSLDYMHKGIDATLANCSGCEVVATVSLAPTDLINGTAQTKISSAFVKYGEQVDTVLFDSDTSLTPAIPVLKSNRNPDWHVQGNEGLPTTIPLVGNLVTSMVTMPTNWLGWCGAYTLNSVFANEEVTDCGIGFLIVDESHNPPVAGQQFGTTTIDYQSIMKDQWAAN